MQKSNRKPLKMKVFQKGQVVIPVSLRRKYNIGIGDQLEVIPESGGILLNPAQEDSPAGSLTDRLYGVFGEYAKKQKSIKKADIQKATHQGFIEEWAE